MSKKIAAVEQDAKDNLTKYTAQQKLEDEVTTTWNDKSVELASGNESSKLKEQQAKLDELLEKLNAQKATDKADYEAGNAKKNDETNTAALKKIQKEIVDLVTAAMEGYDEQIAADNSGMLDAIAAAKKSAQAAFDKATETVNSYKNLKSDEAKEALKGVKAAYDNVTNALYETPTNMSKTWDEAQAEFDETTSPTVFDKDSSYVKKFEGYEETIAKAESDFINDVKTALNTAVGDKIKDYNAKITTAETTVKGYTLTDDDAKAEVFDALKALVAEAETAMSSPKVKELDDALVALKTFDADLKTALDAAAKLDLEIEKLEKFLGGITGMKKSRHSLLLKQMSRRVVSISKLTRLLLKHMTQKLRTPSRRHARHSTRARASLMTMITSRVILTVTLLTTSTSVSSTTRRLTTRLSRLSLSSRRFSTMLSLPSRRPVTLA